MPLSLIRVLDRRWNGFLLMILRRAKRLHFRSFKRGVLPVILSNGSVIDSEIFSEKDLDNYGIWKLMHLIRVIYGF